MVDQGTGFNLVAGVFALRQDRHKSLRKRTLGEQAAQQIGNPERNEESIGIQTGAERAGDQELADEAGDAGEQRKAADFRESAQKIHGAEYTVEVHGAGGFTRSIRTLPEFAGAPPVNAFSEPLFAFKCLNLL